MMRASDELSRRAALSLLGRLRHGRLEVVEGERRLVFGEPASAEPLTATVEVLDNHFYRSFLRGSLGLAESYIAGEWECSDLTSLVRVGARNMPVFDRMRGFYRVAEMPARRIGSWLHDAGRHRARTARHYNLGNELFALMLDPSMTYSSAIFDRPGMSLEEAQVAKFESIAKALELGPGDNLLEIGTGWGAFAMHAAGNYGVQVTSATISSEQARLARERVEEAGLSDRIEVVESDFAELSGQYDKLVSVEMVETIGWKRFDEFFAVCDRLVRPGGLMCHQIITIDDRAYEAEKMSRSFINTLIFDGGSLPSNAYIARAIERMTDMQMVGFRDITDSYPPTLRSWRENFNAGIEQLRELGYDAGFERLWNLYLAYCEAGFIERRILVGQGLYRKRTNA